MSIIYKNMVGDVVKEYEAKNRNQLIQKNIRMFLIFCHRTRIINGEDFFKLYLYINQEYSPAASQYFFVLDDKDDEVLKNRIKTPKDYQIIDLRVAIEKLKNNRHKYDWAELEGYI